MNPILIIIIAGVVIIAGVLAFLLQFKRQKKQDLSGEDLTTEIESSEIPVGPTPIIRKEKPKIGEIDIFVRDKKISSREITDPEIRIGRDPTKCTVIISEPIVSKLHCSIITRDNRVFIIDNDSTNGTYIGSDKVSEKELGDYETIFLGKKGTIKMVFRKRD